MSDARKVVTQAVYENTPGNSADADVLSDAILSAINEAGYVIVLREPTEAMLCKLQKPPGYASRDYATVRLRAGWQAMIGALDARTEQ